MCCKLTVSNLDREAAAALLAIGMFSPMTPTSWKRELSEEETAVVAMFVGTDLQLQITPAISHYSHHADKRMSAGVYFEMAAKMAEKVGGVITQKAQVAGCKIEGSAFADLVVARYPDMPLNFTQICPGFQAVFLGESHD